MPRSQMLQVNGGLHIITTGRITSGDELKYLKVLAFGAKRRPVLPSYYPVHFALTRP